jgi:hypothetical protein
MRKWPTRIVTWVIALLVAACGNGGLPDAGPASFMGEYGVAFSGDGRGQLRVNVGSDRHARVYALNAATGTQVLVTETDLTPQGSTTFTVVGALGTATYQGTFRFDATNAFGWGSWSSTSGTQGVWGAYRDDNNYGFSSDEIDLACTRINAGGLCSTSTSGVETIEQCRSRIPCRFGFVGANGAECLAMLSQALHQAVAATSAADCPNLTGEPPPQWTDAGCVADMGACDSS